MNDVYKAYYTKSDPIVSYMISKLSLINGVKILEPCAGDGVFIDAINELNGDFVVDAYELDPNAVKILESKYDSHHNIKIIHDDTLKSLNLSLLGNGMGVYDRIIANPPYGAWIGYDERKSLKKIYPTIYTKETYTLFLYKCIQLLKENGILVFIIPDTFLNLHMHKKLREYILFNTIIDEICLFPSSFFPGVNFGYANLCIITIRRCNIVEKCLNNNVRIIKGMNNVKELKTLAKIEYIERENIKISNIKQSDIASNKDYALLLNDEPKINSLLCKSDKSIGDIADCVTGFYSGNDKRYLHPLNENHKNAKKYAFVEKSKIYDGSDSDNILNGISGEKHFIQIIKGGGPKYYQADMWYMDWGKEAVDNYKKDRKARFQNSKYYFKYGIGVPMISSKKIKAVIIENKLFDQSIVGVFPKDSNLVYYLLAFFNSTTCNKLIRTINPSANNPANYIKKIPFIEPTEDDLMEIDNIVADILARLKSGVGYSLDYECRLEKLIKSIYGF